MPPPAMVKAPKGHEGEGRAFSRFTRLPWVAGGWVSIENDTENYPLPPQATSRADISSSFTPNEDMDRVLVSAGPWVELRHIHQWSDSRTLHARIF
jgi:hypothetical protein